MTPSTDLERQADQRDAVFFDVRAQLAQRALQRSVGQIAGDSRDQISNFPGAPE
jgi:hypothetical protein